MIAKPIFRTAFILLLSGFFSPNTLAFGGEAYEKPSHRRQPSISINHTNSPKTLTQKQLPEEEKEEEETLPLTLEEREVKARKKAAKEAAVGGTIGAALWGAGNLGVHVNNTLAAGSAVATTFPPLMPLISFVAIGGAIGALYGYGTSE